MQLVEQSSIHQDNNTTTQPCNNIETQHNKSPTRNHSHNILQHITTKHFNNTTTQHHTTHQHHNPTTTTTATRTRTTTTTTTQDHLPPTLHLPPTTSFHFLPLAAYHLPLATYHLPPTAHWSTDLPTYIPNDRPCPFCMKLGMRVACMY